MDLLKVAPPQWRVFVYVLRYREALHGTLICASGAESLNHRPWRRREYPAATLHLRRLVASLKPNVVQSHHFDSGALSLLAVAGTRTYHLHIRRHLNEAQLFNRPIHAFIDRTTARFADHVVAISPAVAKHLRVVDGVAPEQVSVVENGVDLDHFRPLAQGPTSRETLRLCYVGTLSYLKGVDLAIRAVAVAQARSLSVTLRIVGDGPQRNALEQLTEDLGCREFVAFVGWHDDVRPLLWSSDALIAPSRSEAFGKAVVEGMASGLPVIATSVGGLVDIVVPGETGTLVPPEDPGALAHAISELASDSNRRQRYGRAGRQRAVRLFGFDRMASAYIGLYTTLVGDGASHERAFGSSMQ